MNAVMTRKGLTAATLERFGVVEDGDRLRFPNGEVYDPSANPKMEAPKGKPRDLWPDPADLPADLVLVVEGRPDVLSAWELGYSAVSVPSARRLRDDEAMRIARGRERSIVVCDCDGSGRPIARQWAERIAHYGPAALADPAPDRDDGFDIGDMLAEALTFYGEDGRVGARRWLASRISPAEIIVARVGLLDGAAFALGASAHVEAVWGRGSSVLWPSGEPLMIVAPDGVGKTTLGQQLALRRAGLGDGFLLGYPVAPSEGRVLYIAADRPRQAGRSMRRMVSEADRLALAERLLVWRGALPFDLVRDPSRLAEWSADLGVGTILIDSLKDVLSRPADEESGLAFTAAAAAAVAAGIEITALHHQRKAQGENKNPMTLADVYGSRWLTAACGSVLLLWGKAGDSIVELRHLKPADDVVGPLTLVHDNRKGTTIALDAPDLLTVVEGIGEATAVQVAEVLYGSKKPDRSSVERARRRLDTAVEEGRLERIEPDGSGRGNTVVWKVTPGSHAHHGQAPAEVTPEPPFRGGRDGSVTEHESHVTPNTNGTQSQESYMRWEAARLGERDDDEPEHEEEETQR
jgi:hypothetical protein